MAAVRHLCFYKFEILAIDRLRGLKCVIVIIPNFTAIHPTFAELWRFNDFSKWLESGIVDFKDWNL